MGSVKQNSQLNVHRTSTPVVDFYYVKGDDHSIERAVITAIAKAAGVPSSDLPPVYGSIDLDAVSLLFDNHDGAADAGALLTFKFEKWNVFVRADGLIRVCDGTHHTDPKPVFDGSPSAVFGG